MNGRKKKKPVNKKPAKKKARGKSARVSNLKKRRGKEVYDVLLKTGAKSREEIENVIDKIRKFKELPDYRVKLTFVAGHRNKKSSISYNYDVDEPEQINESLQEILHSIFTRPVRGTTKSIKRMNRLKNYINRIIIDFETAMN